MELLGQLQRDLLDEEVSLSTILRKARVLASHLHSAELGEWVARELDGYKQAEDLPDYRVISTSCFGVWTNGYYIIKGRGVSLSRVKNEKLKEFLTTFRVRDGIRTVEQHASESKIRFGLSADITSSVNYYVEEDGYGFADIQYAIAEHDFAQILDTVRNRLLDFLLKLGENWQLPASLPPKDELSKLISVVIYNNPQGGDVSVFDQRGQQVQYQFNAAGNISFDAVHDKDALANELEKLKTEIARAKHSNALSADAAVEAEYHVLQATKEARKDAPDKPTFLDHVGKAKGVLEKVATVAGLVSALIKVTEIANTILH